MSEGHQAEPKRRGSAVPDLGNSLAATGRLRDALRSRTRYGSRPTPPDTVAEQADTLVKVKDCAIAGALENPGAAAIDGEIRGLFTALAN